MEICEGYLNGFPGLMNLMLFKISCVAVNLNAMSTFPSPLIFGIDPLKM